MTSVKTTLLLAALGLAWSSAWAMSSAFREMYPARRIAECAVAGAAGFSIVPALFLGWFAGRDALDAMRFCLLDVNQPDAPAVWRLACMVAGVAMALSLAWRWRSRECALRSFSRRRSTRCS